MIDQNNSCGQSLHLTFGWNKSAKEVRCVLHKAGDYLCILSSNFVERVLGQDRPSVEANPKTQETYTHYQNPSEI